MFLQASSANILTLFLNSTGNFLNSALLINGTQSPSTAFKLMHISSNVQPLVDMWGDGTTHWHNGQLEVVTGGVLVTGGGESCLCPCAVPCVSPCAAHPAQAKPSCPAAS